MATESVTALPVHRIDVDTYNRIVESGALDDARVELLEGIVTEMSRQSPAHADVIEALTHHFAGAEARLRVQLPLEVPPDSQPVPDLALSIRKPAGQHPRTALLVVEVAVSSLPIDRTVKTRLYARAGVPVYWIVDVSRRALEAHSQPSGDRYTHVQVHHEGALVPCPVAGAQDLDLSEILAGVEEAERAGG